MSEKIIAELKRMEEDCAVSGKSQFNASARWTGWNYWFGIPSVALSALAGTAFFKGYPDIAGLMTTGVTVLTALMTFLKPSERSSQHKSAGDQYLALKNDARVFREVRLPLIEDDTAAFEGMEGFLTRRNELNNSSRQPSRADFDKARKGIEAGEALHEVDKKKKR